MPDKKTPYAKSLERNRSVESQTPRHLHNGFIPTVPGMTDLELLPKRFDFFAAEVKQSFEILAGKVLPLLNEIRDIVKAHSAELRHHDDRIAQLEAKHVNHGAKLLEHDTKHAEHAEKITGVYQKLTILETAFVSKTRSKRKARK